MGDACSTAIGNRRCIGILGAGRTELGKPCHGPTGENDGSAQRRPSRKSTRTHDAPPAPPEPSTRTAKRATVRIVESRCGRARTKAAGRDDFLNVLPVRNAPACLQPAHATQTVLSPHAVKGPGEARRNWHVPGQKCSRLAHMRPVSGPCQRMLMARSDRGSVENILRRSAVKSGDCAMPIPVCAAACATRRQRDEPPRKIAGVVWPGDLSCARPCRWFARAADS